MLIREKVLKNSKYHIYVQNINSKTLEKLEIPISSLYIAKVLILLNYPCRMTCSGDYILVHIYYTL